MRRSLAFAVTVLFVLGPALHAQSEMGDLKRSENRPLPSLKAAAARAAEAARNRPLVFKEIPNRPPKEQVPSPNGALEGQVAPVQLDVSVEAASLVRFFDGASNDDNAAVIKYRVTPPDTDGDVGHHHFIQMINSLTTIFDKAGNKVFGPFPSNAFWDGIGGLCEPYNQGDPIVVYDEVDQRWIVSQFAFDDAFTTFAQCVAVSAGSSLDPTGAWNRYEFSFTSIGFNDYPKLGVVTNSITLMANLFTRSVLGWRFAGTYIGAMDKASMYAGQPASLVGYNLGTGEWGFLAGDLDGPSGAPVPALFATAMTSIGYFDIWQLNVTWPSGSSASRSRIARLAIPSFDTDLCAASREACIPQPGTTQALETLSDRLMHRLQIRDFGTHLSMVTSHTVDVGGGRAGIRWYELRKPGSTWALNQSGTYAPNDGKHRWVPSAALNAAGDLGIGFLLSNSTDTYVSTVVAGQTAAASGSGVLDAGEIICKAGSGAHTGAARSGDYSATSVDPVDDSFWHTNEYVKVTGDYSWHTAVCNFQVSTAPVNQAPVVSITQPEDGGSYPGGTDISFAGTATDAEDGPLSADLAWTSSIDGSIGSGASFSLPLSLGSHTITAQVTDAGGKPGQAQVSITVYDPNPATTMHVAGVVTSVTGGAKTKRGVATVTVKDSKGNPVQGATVTGNFSGTISQSGATGVTDATGVAVIQTATTTAAKTVTVAFCVSNLQGTLTYVPASNAAGTTCAAPPPAQVVHVASVVPGTTGTKRLKGTATVTVHRADESAGAGVVVTGRFSGSFNETVTGTTGSNGVVTLTTSAQSTNPNFTFCIENLSGTNVTYKPLDNHPGVTVCAAGKADIAGALPTRVSLEPNYPNPFNPTTMITYVLAEGGPVTLRVFNLQGREVARLAEGYREAGSYNVLFDASSLSAGVYVYTLQAAGEVQTRRMTILK